MPPFEQKVFSPTDIPQWKDAESFRYKVSFLWDGGAVDIFYTDNSEERDRLVKSAEDQSYDVLVELQK